MCEPIEMNADMMAMMVDDYLVDAGNAFDDDPLVLDGEPYFDDDSQEWTQNAHDSTCSYTLVAKSDGNIYLVP